MVEYIAKGCFFGNNMKKIIVERFVKYLIGIVSGYVSLFFFLGDPGKGLLEKGISKDIISRKNFLVKTLSKGPSAADFFQSSDMQFTGEWALGTYSMATYALTNIAMLEPAAAKESSEIIAKWIEFCLDEKISAFDRIAWNENPLDEKVFKGDRGHIGYYGHLNLMLGCYALLNNDGRFKELHRKICDAITRRMTKYPHRHIETYPYETYPPDNSVSVASLKVADMTLGTSYKQLIDDWIRESKLIEIQPYGLVVFQIDSVSGQPVQTCRGSNIGWNSFFLPLIDEEYAEIQFVRFKKYMRRSFLGFSAFKEHPQGNLFVMDCDTGPVIFGLGGTATAFSVAGARWTHDKALLSGLLRSVEVIGTSISRKDKKKYIVLPVVGDAIILAMKTACRWEPLWNSKRLEGL